jgi:hypothetical protein
MKASLSLIPEKFLNEFPSQIKILFQEIFKSYLIAIKFAIVEYIVRSPNERKRLDISVLP